jgi:5-methylcytosine-specific restriction endonuclease McrA
MAMGRDCAAHTHSEDVPLEVHHIWPKGDGGPDIKTNRISVCANAHGAVHSLIDRARKLGSVEAVPWAIRRRYGVRVRALATAGWAAMRDQRVTSPDF